MTMMMRTMRWVAVASLVIAAGVGVHTWSDADESEVGGADRLAIHVSTDKPIYRPGETVYGRAVMLRAADRRPADDGHYVAWKLLSPKGTPIAESAANTEGGAAPFAFAIPEGTAGGLYKLEASSPMTGDTLSSREISIRSYRAPRLKTDIEFARKAYGPGDEVSARLDVLRAEGGPPAGATASATASLDGAVIFRGPVTIDAEGHAIVAFVLPKQIGDGNGTLAIAIHDGGVQETAAKTIPIVVSRLDVAFYPEGGDLVVGLPSRVYLQARTPRDEPGDLAGRIFDSDGNVLADVRTDHEGRGVFTIKPRSGLSYRLQVDEPKGVPQPFALPSVKPVGVVLSVTKPVLASGRAIEAIVYSTEDAELTVAIGQRERQVAALTTDVTKGVESRFTLTPPLDTDGVLTVTVLGKGGAPLAERLIFRHPARSVKVELSADPMETTPAGTVTLKVKTTDASGKPVSATVGIAASDDAVLTQITKRERAPRLIAQAMLEHEVMELRDVDAYFASDANAPKNLDLLLATQGWRRIAYYRVQPFVHEHGDAAKRALVFRDPIVIKALRRMAVMEKGGMEGRAVGAAPPPMAPAGAPMEGDGAEAIDGGAVLVFGEAEEVVAAGAVEAAGEDMLVELAAAEAMPEPAMEALADPMADKDAENGIAADDARDEDFARKPMREPMPAAKPMPGVAAAEMMAAEAVLVRMKDRLDREFVAVREYAHKSTLRPEGARRTDFTETVYWNAGVKTNADGVATVSFDLSDAVTAFSIRADAVDGTGALGEATIEVTAKKPFYVEAKLPLEVTAGDVIRVPIALVNGTNATQQVALKLAAGEGVAVTKALPTQVMLEAGARSRLLLDLEAMPGAGEYAVRLIGQAGGFQDDLTRSLRVAPRGFPIDMSFGGRLAADAAAKHAVTIPAGVVAGSVRTEAIVYPSPLASLQQAVEALLREPYGCFEQTSSSNYPNVMVMRYLKTHSGVDPAIVARAEALLDRGYKQLVGFECRAKGYEWFGGDPGHEALSAYGVLEFTDMAGVYAVDQGMLDRTRAWLRSRRNGDGGYSRNERALDTFGSAPPDITDVYITWALVEAGERDLAKELARVKELALASEDAYLGALAANVLTLVKDDAARAVLDRLVKAQKADGSLCGNRTSITGSGGDSLAIETTALAISAWLRSKDHQAPLEKAMQWLLARCKNGSFGATQSTILALRAIVAYDDAHATPKQAGAVLIAIDGEVIDEVPFAADRQGPITLPSVAAKLTPGAHTLELRMVGGSAMPYSMSVGYHAETPASAAECKVELEAKLARTDVLEGDPVEVMVKLANRTDGGLPMTLAIIGLPGGLEVRHDQLKELQKEGKIDFFETRGREVILYFRQMAPKETKDITISCVAAIPGRYTGPASRAYLYYTPEHKVWRAGLAASVQAQTK